MYKILLFTALVLPSLLGSQDFIVDPSNDRYYFEVNGVIFMSSDVVPYSEGLHGKITTFSTNGGNQHKAIEMGLSPNTGGGEIHIYSKSQAQGIYLDGQEFTLYRDVNVPKIKISNSSGLEVYNNNNGNLMYRINSQIISGYRNDGVETIRINTNKSGRGRLTSSELELTGGSDFAEHFTVLPGAEHISPGHIVSVVPGTNGKLQLSKKKYDSKVIGIVSGANGIQTGLMMGQKGSLADGDLPVALSGRTYVYATNENGPIVEGDFLTSSSTPGHAMKATKRKKAQGAIIGKALTSMHENVGYVLVLVTLQ